MSVRTNILDQVRTELKYITTANGYANECRGVYEGYKILSENNEFDTVYFFFGDDDPVYLSNDNKPVSQIVELFLIIQCRADSGEAKLSRKIESWIEDIRKWIGIRSRSGITTDKWQSLDAESPLTGVMPGSATIGKISGFALWERNIAEITVPIKIEYELN